MATNYGAFKKGNSNRIAWSRNERTSLMMDKWVKSPLGPKRISLSEVQSNIKSYNSLQKNTALAPLAERSLRTGVSNAKMTFMGGMKSGGRTIKNAAKRIPGAITKGKGILGKLAMGAVGMLNVAVMKGANKTVGTFERYMKDGAMSKNILNTSRIGKSIGITSGIGLSTVGLSNALSKNRHGRG